MKTIRILLILFLLVTVMLSCTQKVDFDDLNIRYIDRIVVNGMITTEKKEHKVLLYHSSDLNSSDSIRMESGASVSITDGSNTIILVEKKEGEYTTSSDFKGEVNKTYTLNFQLKNGDEYSASSYLYPSMIIDTMYSQPNGNGNDIYVKAHNPKDQGAACMIDFYANDSLLTSYLRDKVVYAKWSFYENLFSIPNADLTKDTSCVKMRLYSISYLMFQNIKDIGNETWWSAEPFRTTPANVRTNISNGGLGFFLASDIVEKQISILKSR